MNEKRVTKECIPRKEIRNSIGNQGQLKSTEKQKSDAEKSSK
jgi:hypothetical protein